MAEDSTTDQNAQCAFSPEQDQDSTGSQTATPMAWRLTLGCAILVLTGVAYFLQDVIGPRGQAACGVLCFLGVAALFATSLRDLNWRTIGWGIVIQVALAIFVIKIEVGGIRPGHESFLWVAQAFKKFLDFSDIGARFVFGPLADPDEFGRVFPNRGFVFAFSALPTIIFVSSFFTLLHYLGVIQILVSLVARAMKYLMQTSGAETLAAVENVFMGQSEAPLIVAPYISQMTRSELLALMCGGMATLSGGMIAVYIGMGVDPVALLATGIMSAPCSLYLAKILLPETQKPKTMGGAHPTRGPSHANALEAIAAGASSGMYLALHIAAMLIAFLAFIALLDFLLGSIWPDLSLHKVFSYLFAPVALLLGVNGADIPAVANLLGTKLVANEFVAYLQLTGPIHHGLSPRAFTLATYALAGFANFSSIGIQIGAMGTLAPTRRADLAKLGLRALLAGFLATLLNAAIAGVLLDDA